MQSPAHAPILFKLATPLIKLLFDGLTQRLVLIELLDPADHATYKGQRLQTSQPGQPARKALHRLFGPTYSPSPHPANRLDESLLVYPGVAFGLKGAPSDTGLYRSRRS